MGVILLIHALFLSLLIKVLDADKVGECECTERWGKCNSGFGEDAMKGGCGDSHKTCAQLCPGMHPWKQLYRTTVDKEFELESQCESDPTEKWGLATLMTSKYENVSDTSSMNERVDSTPPSPLMSPRFAVAFAGGMRSFAATWSSWEVNVIEPSGGNVDLYFHVWDDEHMNARNSISVRSRELAQSLPNTKAYVGEQFSDHLSLLNQDEPDLDGNTHRNTSWLSYVQDGFSENEPHQEPFVIGPTFSQFRKVYLAVQLVLKSKIKYTLVLRARPDHIFIAPLDLRHFAFEFSQRPSVINARGHFLAIPERSPQYVTDQFAMGSLEAMLEYAEKPMPYITSCCEGYTQRNLKIRCFSRTPQVLTEEFNDVPRVENLKHADWGVVPSTERRSVYSPMLFNHHTLSVDGSRACFKKDNKCIPLYRTRYTYIHRIVTKSWVSDGVVCTGLMGDGVDSGKFLIEAGVASHNDETVSQKHNFGPCLAIPALEEAWRRTNKLMEQFTQKDRDAFGKHVGRK